MTGPHGKRLCGGAGKAKVGGKGRATGRAKDDASPRKNLKGTPLTRGTARGAQLRGGKKKKAAAATKTVIKKKAAVPKASPEGSGGRAPRVGRSMSTCCTTMMMRG